MPCKINKCKQSEQQKKKQKKKLKQKEKATQQFLKQNIKMGGCLGPKQRRQEVYIEMIQTIHQQVTHMTFIQSENLDMYQAMKQKLSKKGLLRKFIDNLVSHRNKIYDSLNHNYQIVLQNSRLQNKYAGLLIIDQIIQGIYASFKSSSHNIMNQQDSQDFTNMSTNKKTDFFQQSVQQMFSDKSRKQSKLAAAMQGNPLIREIDSRFDMIYFNLIIYLLDNVPKMYLRILKSINSFCLNKKSKFNCTQSVWQVMNFIMVKKIQKQLCLRQSVLTYQLLLQNTKQNFKDYQKSSDLKMFIKLWMHEQQKISKQKSPQILFTNVNEDSQTSTAQSEQNIMMNLIKIMSLYFNTNISTWNSQYLYEILIDTYDENEFLIQKIGSFQMVIFSVVDKNELHVHFYRGLFLLLLDYLCYKVGQRGSKVQSGTYGNPQDIRWPNSQKKAVKFNALKTLRRWVSNKHVDFNQTVSYNCNLLFAAYLTNFHTLDPQLNTQISKQFLKLVREHLQSKSRQIVVLTIIQAIKHPQTDPKIRTLIVSLMRELLQDKQMFSQFIQNFDFIITIDEHYSKQNQLEIIQLMGFVVKTMPNEYFKQSIDLISSELFAFKHKICEFMYSCFEVLVYSSADQIFKYRFTCSVISFLRGIKLKNNLSFVYAYYLQLMKVIKKAQNNKHNANSNYFVLYLIYEIGHLLIQQIKVPTDFRILNQKISLLTNSHNQSNKLKSPMKDYINSLIEKVVNQLKYSQPQNIRQQFHQNHIQYELKRLNMINEQNLSSICKILTSYFVNSCVRNKNLSTKDQNQDQQFDKVLNSANKTIITNSFGRRDSIYHQSQNSSYYRQEDKNIKDVIGIING